MSSRTALNNHEFAQILPKKSEFGQKRVFAVKVVTSTLDCGCYVQLFDQKFKTCQHLMTIDAGTVNIFSCIDFSQICKK